MSHGFDHLINISHSHKGRCDNKKWTTTRKGFRRVPFLADFAVKLMVCV